MNRIFGTLIALSALVSVATANASTDVEALQDIETRFCSSIVSMDVGKIMELYLPSESLHVYDMMKPREYKGAKALRKDWETFLGANVESIDKCENLDFVPYIGGGLAASHFVQHVEFTGKSGDKAAANTRMTHVYRKFNGKWLIIHEHGSYPIDWATGKGDLLSTE